MREQVVTSFGPAGEVFGRRMVETAIAYWPAPVVAYVDDVSDVPVLTRMTADIPGWLETQPTLPMVASDPDAIKPIGYLWQAAKFAVKVFVWRDAAERLERGILTWLDADTVVRKAVPAGFTEGLLRDRDVVMLGRNPMHPDTGFVAFRIPEALPLLRWCCDAYTSGRFRRIRTGWTDCHVLKAGLKATKTPIRDLTTHLGRTHWDSRMDAVAMSPLGPYLKHLKGKKRKLEALK